MSELLAYFQLGVRHIVDVEALDHILFLVALAAIYRFRDVRALLWVITAFTIGHSVTLALAVTGMLALPSALIEFLIPVTIVVTGVENILFSARPPSGRRYRPVFAGVFGLVHGAGFATYLRAMFVDRLAVPLFGFNLGIEAGQLIVLAVAALALAVLDVLLIRLRATRTQWPVLRIRSVAVSVAVVAIASRWAVLRSPW